MKEPREWSFRDLCDRTMTMHVWRNNVGIRIIQEKGTDEPYVLADADQAESLGKEILRMAEFLREQETKK